VTICGAVLGWRVHSTTPELPQTDRNVLTQQKSNVKMMMFANIYKVEQICTTLD